MNTHGSLRVAPVERVLKETGMSGMTLPQGVGYLITGSVYLEEAHGATIPELDSIICTSFVLNNPI